MVRLRRRGERGYSVAELMMVTAIIGILAMVAPQLFIQITRFFRQNQARVDIQRDARSAFGLMSRNLRQAQSSTITIDQVAGQPPYSRVNFTKMDGTDVTYYQEDATLYISVGGGVKPIAENLKYIAFSFPRTDDTKLLAMTMTLEKSTYEGQVKALQLSVEKIRIHND